MIVLKANCEECIHKGVCSFKGNAASAMNKLKNMTYDTGPNDDYSWDIMMQHKRVNVSFSCPNFKKELEIGVRPRKKNIRVLVVHI